MSNIFLGYPPPSIREWIEKNYVKEEIVDDLNTPLTFTAEEPNAVVKMISYNGPEVVLETSVDGGVSWQPFYVDETEITLANVGDKVMFRSCIHR